MEDANAGSHSEKKRNSFEQKGHFLNGCSEEEECQASLTGAAFSSQKSRLSGRKFKRSAGVKNIVTLLLLISSF